MRTALDGVIKRPVKEAVREAFAEGLHDRAEANRRDDPATVEVTGGDEGDGTDAEESDEDTSPGGLRRLLGRRRVAVLAALAAVTLLRRRLRSSADTDTDRE